MKRFSMLACLLLLACSRDPADTVVNLAAEATPVPLSPGDRPVRIGEDGPGFDACGATGAVANLAPAGNAYLSLRAAPFVEAVERARLANDTRLYLCSRSVDQKWQGVVVPPDGAPDLDCGVSSPVDSPRDYAGPCRSGWVSSAFVRPVAG